MSWRNRYIFAEKDGRRTYFLNKKEVSTLVFDCRYRSQPQMPSSTNFRFEADGRISGHPSGLQYDWDLLDSGRTITLGLFPPARVRRLKSWAWAVTNPNIVCISEPLEHGIDSPDGLPEEYAELFNISAKPKTLPPVIRALMAMDGQGEDSFFNWIVDGEEAGANTSITIDNSLTFLSGDVSGHQEEDPFSDHASFGVE